MINALSCKDKFEIVKGIEISFYFILFPFLNKECSPSYFRAFCYNTKFIHTRGAASTTRTHTHPKMKNDSHYAFQTCLLQTSKGYKACVILAHRTPLPGGTEHCRNGLDPVQTLYQQNSTSKFLFSQKI